MAKLERRQTGIGKKPALLIVDAINAFTDPECPLGTRVDEQIRRIRQLLDRFRELDLPVYFTSQAYTDNKQASVWREKLPATKYLESGTRWVDVDERIEPRPGETIIVKHGPSAFFETNLKRQLLEDSVDSVFVVGFTTSGCVRASAVDSVSGNFRTVVVSDCCGDRDPDAHRANLYDLDAKYADLMELKSAMKLLEKVSASAA